MILNVKIFIISFLWETFFSFSFSQDGAHGSEGHFLKRIEYNSRMGECNLAGKTDVEKLFFGDYNALVEFSFCPSFEGASGVRMIRDSLGTSYVIEIKYIANYEEANKEVEGKCYVVDVPVELINSMPRSIFDLLWEYNRSGAVNKRRIEDLLKLYKVETHSFPISNQFAEKLYEKMVSFIGNFKAIGTPAAIFDGYSVTFRTVVEDEVWSLNIHMPQGEALKMANLCRQIIADARTGKHDELRYIDVLDAFRKVVYYF